MIPGSCFFQFLSCFAGWQYQAAPRAQSMDLTIHRPLHTHTHKSFKTMGSRHYLEPSISHRRQVVSQKACLRAEGHLEVNHLVWRGGGVRGVLLSYCYRTSCRSAGHTIGTKTGSSLAPVALQEPSVWSPRQTGSISKPESVFRRI